MDNIFIGDSDTILFLLLGKYLEAKTLSRTNEAIRKLAEIGAKEAFVLRGGKEIKVPLSELMVGDKIIVKPGEKIPVGKLEKQGFSIVMITGDDRATAESIAKDLGVNRVIANVLPEEKARAVGEIRENKENRGKIAFVGDGINDASALATADLGIAMGGGTDVAKETGDIILVRSDPLDVLRSIKLAQATFNKVKFNFFWAFIYNILGIPIAAGVLSGIGITLKPEYAGLMMAFSSISVVANSLLLKSKKLD